MSYAYIFLGVGLLVASIADLLWTTLWVEGGSGPLSSKLASTVWQGLRGLVDGRSRALSLAGPLILFLTLTMWVGLIWAGWTLVLVGGQGALLSAHSSIPVTWTGVTYFVAYTMFGVGNGGFYPPEGVWQLVTSLVTASGVLFIAMGVSYVLSVLEAVSHKRSFASSVFGIGDDGVEIVRAGWNGEGFDGLPLHSLATQLDQLADQHKSYPILHYYHSERPQQASAVAVAVFDEAMSVIRFGVDPDHRPDEVPLENARSACGNYVETLNDGLVQPAEEAPPIPDLDRLREADIPTVPEREFAYALEALDERRRKLLGVVRADAWSWPPIED